MRIITIALVIAAMLLDATLFRRKTRAGYYKRWHSKRWGEVVVRVIFYGPLLLLVWLINEYPLWLQIANVTSVAIYELALLAFNTEDYYDTVTTAYRFFGKRSPDAKTVGFMRAGPQLIALSLCQSVLQSSWAYLIFGKEWEAPVAILGATACYFVPIFILFWLSHRRLYRADMQKLETHLHRSHDTEQGT